MACILSLQTMIPCPHSPANADRSRRTTLGAKSRDWPSLRHLTTWTSPSPGGKGTREVSLVSGSVKGGFPVQKFLPPSYKESPARHLGAFTKLLPQAHLSSISNKPSTPCSQPIFPNHALPGPPKLSIGNGFGLWTSCKSPPAAASPASQIVRNHRVACLEQRRVELAPGKRWSDIGLNTPWSIARSLLGPGTQPIAIHLVSARPTPGFGTNTRGEEEKLPYLFFSFCRGFVADDLAQRSGGPNSTGGIAIPPRANSCNASALSTELRLDGLCVSSPLSPSREILALSVSFV
ncbi:hypothetical protein GQ53DRAFT_438597 [Thozetella sp. PMI_491]|nr:hypothetical protein GQ53DRAFT_438597 [Thozetella sp. PMI_491]